MRGGRATGAAKRRQRADGPCDRASKSMRLRLPTGLLTRKAVLRRPSCGEDGADRRGRRARHVVQGLSRNLGDLDVPKNRGAGPPWQGSRPTQFAVTLRAGIEEVGGTWELRGGPARRATRRIEKSELPVVLVKPGKLTEATRRREGAVGVRNRRRARWPRHWIWKTSQRNADG